MRFLHRTLPYLSVVTLLGTLVSATTKTGAQEGAPQSGGLVRLFALATDSQGQVVSDLTRDDFIVLDDNKPQNVELFEKNLQPITTIVLIDRSASMMGTFEPLVSAFGQFLSAMTAGDEARAGTFSDKVQLTSRFTSDHKEVLTELRTLGFGDGTKLHDAMLTSFMELQGRPGLRVVIVITDGDDTASRASRNKVLEQERTDDVIVYAIGLETQYFNGIQVVRNKPGRPLRQLAEETGGGFLEAPRVASAPANFAQINRELRGLYLLGFAPERVDGRVHKLEVQSKRSGIGVRARRSYLRQKPAPR